MVVDTEIIENKMDKNEMQNSQANEYRKTREV